MKDTPNSMQIGGSHYQRLDYQHWDMASQTKLPYLIGSATKYVSRWPHKGGAEDLEKAAHCLLKAEEQGIYVKGYSGDEESSKLFSTFAVQFKDSFTRNILYRIFYDISYKEVTRILLKKVDELRKVKTNAGANYIRG